MPRYFLQWEPFGSKDKVGEDHPSDAAAHESAKAVARNLARNRTPGPTEHVAVLNAAGKVLSVAYLK